MQPADFIALSPFILLGGGIVVTMLVLAVLRQHALVFFFALATLAAAFASIFLAATVAPRRVTILLVIDRFALSFTGLVLAACIVVMILSWDYLSNSREQREEFYLLLLLATFGSITLTASSHFVSFFLGLEILSVGLYALIGYLRTERRSIEAGLKYLVMAGASSAILLFGMALVYSQTGTMAFDYMTETPLPGSLADPTGLAGVGLIIVGIAFKLALVPFHMWASDVYAGAPVPVTAFVATVSKAAMFAVLFRYFFMTDLLPQRSLYVVITVIAVSSMLIGNLLALLQNSVKRILAYSSIAHLGYLLTAFLASGVLGASAAGFYFVAYFVTTLAAFSVVTILSAPAAEADDIEHYRGLYWRRPWLATCMTTSMLSLAGIPLTAGFIGKFYLVVAGVDSSLWILVMALITTSVIGLYYYLRVIVFMFGKGREEGPIEIRVGPLPLGAGIVVTLLFLTVVWLGMFPTPVQSMVMAAMSSAM